MGSPDKNVHQDKEETQRESWGMARLPGAQPGANQATVSPQGRGRPRAVITVSSLSHLRPHRVQAWLREEEAEPRATRARPQGSPEAPGPGVPAFSYVAGSLRTSTVCAAGGVKECSVAASPAPVGHTSWGHLLCGGQLSIAVFWPQKPEESLWLAKLGFLFCLGWGWLGQERHPG